MGRRRKIPQRRPAFPEWFIFPPETHLLEAQLMYIVDFLQSRGIGFETLLHRPAFSATRRARNMRVTGREVAKTVLVKSGEEFVLAVLPATSRMELSRLAAALHAEPE